MGDKRCIPIFSSQTDAFFEFYYCFHISTHYILYCTAYWHQMTAVSVVYTKLERSKCEFHNFTWLKNEEIQLLYFVGQLYWVELLSLYIWEKEMKSPRATIQTQILEFQLSIIELQLLYDIVVQFCSIVHDKILPCLLRQKGHWWIGAPKNNKCNLYVESE